MTVKSLLPLNFAPLERDIERSAGRIEQVNIPIADLWDPMKCPVEVLPYLAWALSVDQWETAWSEQIKRKVVSQSLYLHAQKGTRAAVEKALSVLSAKTKLVEWFEAAPKGTPGTFEVKTYISDRGVDEQLWREIDAAVKDSKNLRSHYTLTLNLLSRAKTGIGVGILSGERVVLQPLQSLALNQSVKIGIAAGQQLAVSMRIAPIVTRKITQALSLVSGIGVTVVNSVVLQPFVSPKSPLRFSLNSALALQCVNKIIIYPRI